MVKKATSKLKFQIIFEEFLKKRDWHDELDVNAEKKLVTLNTGVRAGSHSGRLIIEGNDANDVVDFFFYLDIRCKEAKLDQMALLLSEIHERWKFGRFVVFRDGGIVRWQHRIDFEGSQPTGLSIERNVSPGEAAIEEFGDVIAAVALTKQTAAEAIAQYDEEQKSKTKDD